MTAFTAIPAALDSHMNDYATDNSIRVAWENRNFTPTTGESYLRATYLAGTTEPTGIESASDDHIGVYQVDIITAIDTGKVEANTQADAIADYFKRGTLLTYDGIDVRVTSVSIGNGARDGAYYIKSISINCRSFSPAR